MGDVIDLSQDRFEQVRKELGKALKEWRRSGQYIGEILREVQSNPEWYMELGYSDLYSWVAAEYNIKRTYADNLISYSSVMDDLEHEPWQPDNENQAREFRRLNREQRVRVSNFISQEYGDQKLSALDIKSAIGQVAPTPGGTYKPEVAEARTRKKWFNKVENACAVLAEQGDAKAFIAACGLPPSARAALRFLNKIAKTQGWK